MLALVASLPLVEACSERTSTSEVAESGALSTSESRLNVEQGATAAITVRLDGGTDPLKLAALDVPTGITVQFGAESIGNGNPSALVTFAVAANAAVGQRTIRIQASGADATRFVDVVVNVRQRAFGAIVAAPAVLLTQGESARVRVSFTRTPGIADSVRLSLSGVPPEVSAAWSTQLLTAGETTSELTLTANLTAPISASTVTILATKASGESVSTPLMLTIAPSTTPRVTIGVGPPSVVMNVDSAAQLSVTLLRSGGFAGPVFLSVEELPSGLVPLFEPAVLTGNASVLKLQATPSAQPGDYTLKVRGTAAGIPETSARVQVRVLPRPGISISSPSVYQLSVGGSGLYTVSVVRTGEYLHPVVVSFEALPAGVTAAPFQSSIEQVSTILSAGPSAVAGTYQVTVRVRGPGNIEATKQFELTIRAF